MESIKELGKKYMEILKEMDRTERAIAKNPSKKKAGENYLAGLEIESATIWKQIEAFRRSSVNRVGYTVRSDFRGAQRPNMEKLRKQAATYRFCMEQAQKADKRGDHDKATRLRGKARTWAEDMSMIRRSSTRTLDTPVGDGSLQVKRPTGPVKR